MKIKTLLRRWRKLSKRNRQMLVLFAVLAIFNLPFSPISSMWFVVLFCFGCIHIAEKRASSYDFFILGRLKEAEKIAPRVENMVASVKELAEAHIDLVAKHKKLQTAHNKLLRRRRKE
jgi:hypothetical protein